MYFNPSYQGRKEKEEFKKSSQTFKKHVFYLITNIRWSYQRDQNTFDDLMEYKLTGETICISMSYYLTQHVKSSAATIVANIL